MDRKTVVGLLLIGLILAVFTFLNKPSEEEIRKQHLIQQEHKASQRKADSIAAISTYGKNDSLLVDNAITETLNGDSLTLDRQDEQTDNNLITSNNIKESTFVIENDKLKVVFTNKGGGVKSVFLKEHQTFEDYAKNRETDKIAPLKLFEEETVSNALSFKFNGETINTKGIAFQPTQITENSITFTANFGDNKKIEQIYSLNPNEYHLNYEIRVNGLSKEVEADKVYLDWKSELLKTEKLLSEQRRSSTVFFQENGGKYDYLSEMSNDELVVKTNVDWVAFKQSYFSAILIPDKPFLQDGTNLKIINYNSGGEKDETHIKQYEAMINIGLNNTENGSVAMKWYFGPNDYNLLKSYNIGIEDLMNYGWGLFRWINVYAIQPLFVWLANFGMNTGIVILLLTIIVKLILTPIQWKMYVSSAKMRILKPEIEAINKKFPNKDQAMEKQMEMMALYRESGASPLSGCVPMLIQMPILFAVFRFFPATFSLRQESFLWADDLSSYDSILDLSFNIPLYGSHVSLFTLLMAVTTLIYTILNSSNQMQPSQPGMPNMKIIMYFFPIMMIFFFNNYSSGLSYYYFVSTLMSILTMIAIKNFFVNEEKLKLKMAEKQSANKVEGKTRKKSKFQERLEEMQRLQQEKMKKAKKK